MSFTQAIKMLLELGCKNTVRLITYFDLQKFYKRQINKMQIIADLQMKKFMSHQLDRMNMFDINRCIRDLEDLFGQKNDVNTFLEYYLKIENFHRINLILSESKLSPDSRSLLEMKDFLRICNLMLGKCKTGWVYDLYLLRKQVLVEANYLPEYLADQLIQQLPNLTEPQLKLLLDDKLKDSRLIWVEFPYLCFINSSQYALLQS